MTVRRVYDGPSYRFVMKFREVIPVPIFQEFNSVWGYGVHDGPSYRFVMKFREVITVPIFQELKCFETKTLDGPSCL